MATVRAVAAPLARAVPAAGKGMLAAKMAAVVRGAGVKPTATGRPKAAEMLRVTVAFVVTAGLKVAMVVRMTAGLKAAMAVRTTAGLKVAMAVRMTAGLKVATVVRMTAELKAAMAVRVTTGSKVTARATARRVCQATMVHGLDAANVTTATMLYSKPSVSKWVTHTA